LILPALKTIWIFLLLSTLHMFVFLDERFFLLALSADLLFLAVVFIDLMLTVIRIRMAVRKGPMRPFSIGKRNLLQFYVDNKSAMAVAFCTAIDVPESWLPLYSSSSEGVSQQRNWFRLDGEEHALAALPFQPNQRGEFQIPCVYLRYRSLLGLLEFQKKTPARATGIGAA
jgi:uncharacterized protein (DUF58 family)